MSNTMNAVPWNQFPTECLFYLTFMGFMQVLLFVLGSFLVALLPRKRPNLIARRIVRLGIFLGLLLGLGSLFNGFWGCLVFNRLYYSADYFIDFIPFWPITQGVIDAPFGNERGKLLGVTLTQLQLVWCAFSLGTWCAIGILYWLISRALDRKASRTTWASRLMVLIMVPCSLVMVAGAWNVIAPDWLYHYRYGSPPLSNFFPPFLHPPHDTVTVGMLRGYFIWPEWSVYVIWCVFIAIGLAVPTFVFLRIIRDGRVVNRDLPILTKRRLQIAFLLGGLLLAGAAVFLVASKQSAAPCAATLIVKEGCKKYWAQVNSKTAFDTPTWDDLRPYFPCEWKNTNWRDGQPVCPEGGTYTLGPVGLTPTCSIGGRRHSIP